MMMNADTAHVIHVIHVVHVVHVVHALHHATNAACARQITDDAILGRYNDQTHSPQGK
jgi:hypothetical protein